jgi:hypothetical protein
MNAGDHSIVCAVFKCVAEILANGLEKLVDEREREKGAFTSHELCRLCCSLVHAQSSTILTNLRSLLIRHKISTVKLTELLAATAGMRNAAAMLEKAKLSFCTVCAGEHGRMLCTSQGIGRGQIMLQEHPFAFAVAGVCPCREGPLLVEHAILACALHKSRDTNSVYFDQFMQIFVSGLSLSPVGRVPATVGPLQQQGLNDPNSQWPTKVQLQMALASSILCLYEAHTEFTAEYGPVKDLTTSVAQLNPSTHRSTSPASNGNRAKSPTQAEANNYATSKPNMEKIWKERLFSDAWLLMQILSRLPQNTHAVSRVVSTGEVGQDSAKCGGTAVREVQQVRLGYAVFLTASSINHSCKPNATIRYSMPLMSASGVAHGGSAENKVLKYLRDVCIEIVSTESILRHNPHAHSGTATSSDASVLKEVNGAYEVPGEITVSYGPLHGPHSVEQRQTVLQQQYLFTCTCSACVSDLQALLREKTAARDAHHSSNLRAVHSTATAGSAWQKVAAVQGATLAQAEAITQSAVRHTQLLSATAQDTPYLRDRLRSLKAQLTQLNSLFTDVLQQARRQRPPDRSYDVDLLNAFEIKKLHPVEASILDLQRTYFPLAEQLREKMRRLDYCGEHTPYHSDECSGYASDPLYAEFCSAYCNFLDMAGHLAALRDQYPIAAERIHTALVFMLDGRLYPPSDVVVGRERVKLAGLLLSCAQRAACVAQVRCALRILTPVVSAEDPDLVEAKHIYACCLRN